MRSLIDIEALGITEKAYNKRGYWQVWQDGKYYKISRLVIEKVLGFSLPQKAIVHHVDGDRSNDHNSNLVVCEDNAYHCILHTRMRAFAATGNPNFRHCWKCKQWKHKSEFRYL